MTYKQRNGKAKEKENNVNEKQRKGKTTNTEKQMNGKAKGRHELR